MALAEGYAPADLLMNGSISWPGAEKGSRVWDNFVYLQLPDMKRVEKVPADPVADAFHLSQSKSERKNAAFFVEVSQIDLRLSPWRCLMPRVEAAPGSPQICPAGLGVPPNPQVFSTGSHQHA